MRKKRRFLLVAAPTAAAFQRWLTASGADPRHTRHARDVSSVVALVPGAWDLVFLDGWRENPNTVAAVELYERRTRAFAPARGRGPLPRPRLCLECASGDDVRQIQRRDRWRANRFLSKRETLCTDCRRSILGKWRFAP